ncbi:MAG: hypothetical protein D6759_12120, partial [Chloroflexi bacterium]
MLTEALLSAVAEAVFGYLLQEAGLADRVRAVLGVDPERRAFQIALARAYAAFAKRYPDLTASLFDESFLKIEAAPILAQLLTRRGRPNPTELARRWAAHLGHPDPTTWPRLSEVTRAAAEFLDSLEAELTKQPALSPLWDARALEEIRANTAAIHRALEEAFSQALAEARSVRITGPVSDTLIITGDHNKVYQVILQHYPALKDYVYDVDPIIQEVTRRFVGRDFVFNWLEETFQKHRCAYLRLVADAGLGKT